MSAEIYNVSFALRRLPLVKFMKKSGTVCPGSFLLVVVGFFCDQIVDFAFEGRVLLRILNFQNVGVV